MRIFIAGASGLIGVRLVPLLVSAGRAVLAAGGVVIRCGQLYGPGTFFPAGPPSPPRIHVDAAARQTLPSLNVPAGVTLVADDRAEQVLVA